MPIDIEDVNPTVEPAGDKLHRVVRASLGLLPFGSGTAVELFNSLISPPIENRRNKWMADVTEAVLSLQSQNKVNIEDIFKNEEFISFLCEASSYAIRTHQKEKLEALRNAVVNSILPSSPSEFYKHKFLQMISHFSPEHIIIFLFWSDPRSYCTENVINLSDLIKPNNTSSSEREIIDIAIKSFKGKGKMLKIIMKDLYNEKLIGGSSIGEVISNSHPVPSKHTTKLGDEFVQFIRKNV
jgi:hypothetical protein